MLLCPWVFVNLDAWVLKWTKHYFKCAMSCIGMNVSMIDETLGNGDAVCNGWLGLGHSNPGGPTSEASWSAGVWPMIALETHCIHTVLHCITLYYTVLVIGSHKCWVWGFWLPPQKHHALVAGVRVTYMMHVHFFRLWLALFLDHLDTVIVSLESISTAPTGQATGEANYFGSCAVLWAC